MEYPEAVYEGHTGEVTAWQRVRGHEPELVYPNGTKVHYLATGAATDGGFGLYRWETTTKGSGPGPHFHRSMTESFYVLEGTIHIFDGVKWRASHPGDYVHVPPGGIHGFRNETGDSVSMLILFAPGAPREAYFEGLVGVADLDDDERDAFYTAHDNIWLS